MAKQSAIEQDGVIVEALSNAMFRVELTNGHEITRSPKCSTSLLSCPSMTLRYSTTKRARPLPKTRPLSLKKRTPDCKIVRRRGVLYVINKKNPKYKQRQG